MALFVRMRRALQSLFRTQHVESAIDDELRSFLEESAAHKQHLGASPQQAMRAARIEMGSTNAVTHRIRSAAWETRMEIFFNDLRHAVRGLLRTPGFTLIALLSLALGIGANTAIFTLMQQVLLRNLPVRNPERLVTFGLNGSSGVAGGIDLGSFGLFPWYFARQLQANPGPFQGIASYCSFSDKVSIHLPSPDGSIQSNSPAVLAPASLVSGNYFSVLGAQPILGRTISPNDDATPGTGAVVVLSHHFWQQFLSADPAALGKTLSINGTPFAIIGVMPESFHGIKQDLQPPDLWTPISMQTVVLQQPSLLTPNDGAYFLHVFARLSPQAAASKSAFAQSQAWLDQQIRTDMRAHEGAKISPERIQEINRNTVPLVSGARGVSSIRRQYGDSLQILMYVVALVLLIACANLANFLLARAAARNREIATRLALGSSRGRIIRQGLMEAFLLSFTGAVLGLGLAFIATQALITFVRQDNPYIAMSPAPDAAVLLFTLGVSILTGLLFGLAPAIFAARTRAAGSMSASSRTVQSAGGRYSSLWPRILVTAQVTLCLLLLVGAGLFLRTLRNLQNQDFGFERTHLLLAEFNSRLAGYKPSQAPGLHQQLLDRLSAMPGVQSAALSLTPPISYGNWSSTINFTGYTPAPKENRSSMLNRVSGQYFQTAGIPIVAGRAINNADTLHTQKVAVINQTVAQHFFPKGNAVGQMLKVDIDTVAGPWLVVGVARDTHSGDPRSTEPQRMVYLPLAQIEPFGPVSPADAAKGVAPEENQDRFAGVILLRTVGDPARSTADLRDAVAAIDPNLPLTRIITIHDQVNDFMTHDQLISTLTAIFAGLALLLAAIGLYGVLSYSVVRRTNEIGIRIALGARIGRVQWMVLRDSLLLLAIGIAIGLPLSYAAARYIREQLFGLSPLDPITFAIAFIVVSVMTILAAWLPARRAARINPMTALRCD